VVDLRDSGQAFDLPSIQPPNENGVQTSGYGLFLIHRLMDEVQYSPETGNNRWRLVKILT
jgi:anti-sigma regulatory factor (Ser/Thr protein kinase)